MAADTKIYRLILERLELEILSGRLSPGQRMLSVRNLAVQFHAAPNTVQRALNELRQKGLLIGQPPTVLDDAAELTRKRQEKADEFTGQFLVTLRNMGYRDQEILEIIHSYR